VQQAGSDVFADEQVRPAPADRIGMHGLGELHDDVPQRAVFLDDAGRELRLFSRSRRTCLRPGQGAFGQFRIAQLAFPHGQACG